ncbi:MAG: hypothetical protein CBE44_02925 [Bacteroidetes bacterium TMED284]|nr:hypothetical protein [Balneola sp.]OUX47458.1 MAG: hypothetical protein CBE44_02925 [Bacteroidetes bacterium TMED284]
MRKLKGLLLLLISVMVLNGCIVPQYISYDDVVRDSKSEDYFVRIYEDGELEEGDYKVIGEVIINGGVDVNVMMEDVRRKVREIGGDGIIELLVNGSNETNVSGVNGIVTSSISNTFIIKGKVIVLN